MQRFYFVNNDDLVEIIGNSNEPTKIVSHLGKMFAAITSIEMSGGSTGNEGDTVTPTIGTAGAMCSKEGEVVSFLQAVDLSLGVKNWLSALEDQMAVTLEDLLEKAIADMLPSTVNTQEDLLSWIGMYPAQVVVLSSQLSWSQSSERALGESSEGKGEGLSAVVTSLENRLKALSEIVLQDLVSPLRKKCEQLLTEMVHQRDVARLLVANKVCGKSDFSWLYHLRFYWSPKEADRTQRLCIKMSSASFYYGFEYQGIGERLVQTPLTDRCYLTLTQALHFRMGANPFGPAGTGKTETVKMLGSQLGRFVLVFNCDSSFDYAAMGRIFAGLCQVGAWGCLDEFNRLEERILSAVSQQILAIQRGLLLHQDHIELLGNPCKLRKEVGIFVTMNPGYAGRSNLPDNLKQLFRAVAMVVPDRKMIAQVMLFSQGIATAEELAGKIVLLFTLCEEQLSAQSHYDFGLRALKSVLVGAGDLKRIAVKTALSRGDGLSGAEDMRAAEKDVLIKSTCDSVVPKLVSEDIPLFISLLQAVFPGSELPQSNEKQLLAAVASVCEEDSLELCAGWTEKILQLKQVLDMRHGVMMVGPSHTGKTTAWRTLLKALGRVDGVKGDFYVIDPKSIKKEKLYGSLDPNTLEWTDGVFTKLLRKVSEGASLRGGLRRSWIVFDGDVDPEWAENLNSVLDDNKVLTLPSGDRLKIPNNVRIMMEVDSLKHATMATVSRCGMVWFAEDTVPLEVILRQQLRALRSESIQPSEASGFSSGATYSTELQQKTQTQFVDAIASHFTTSPGLVGIALDASLAQQHIMEPSVGRFICTLYSLLVRGIAVALDYNESNSDFPMSDSHIELYAVKWLLHSLLWSFGGSMSSEKRADLGDLLLSHSTLSDQLPSGKNKCRLIDMQVNVADGGWTEWSAAVPKVEIETHKVTSSDVIITTTDTVRHVEVLRAWLGSHKPLILCGPPGSGKTMTLNAILESVPEYVLAPLNFSSGTTPELILKTFAQYCEVLDSPDGLVMVPQRGTYRETQWLVVFCDEINLPEADAYGSQRVIMFLRQLTEQGGFWNSDCKWVSLRRIQFVGACNPPTDAGRVTLSSRFLRHAPLLLVDYPSESSLKQIYRCFNHALLKLHPNLRGSVDPLNNAMVDLYRRNQVRFTAEVAPHYIYSPRELSRWVRAMYEAMEPLEAMTIEELVRLWAHEALRLFHDRLITAKEREWCDSTIDTVAQAHFPGVDIAQCLQRPLLYSNWLNRTYQSTPREQLRSFVAARLKVFYEEELDVPLVIFDDVLEHVLRIDNVLRHPMGHLLLVGDSGVGKTVLSRFVSWMNGLTVFQIKANSKYSVEQFDEDLRGLLRRVGVEGEKICFIFDEGNALSSAFLERMNALLASGEIPGLFEGDERLQLMSACRESYSQRDGLMLHSTDELWRTFTRYVQRNLHVVFTMNPASSDFSNRCTASPALFNRCVVDWFGTWSQGALAQVGSEFTMQLDTGFTKYTPPSVLKDATEGCDAQGALEILSMTCSVLSSSSVTLREAVVAALVSAHQSVKALCIKLAKTTGKQHYLSPRDFLDSIKKFVDTENEKRTFLEEQQTHIRTGLLKLLETQDQVHPVPCRTISVLLSHCTVTVPDTVCDIRR
jgi:dynein heavy chain 1, cytosolic